MTEVLTHALTEALPSIDNDTLDFMAKGGEVSLGDIPGDEREHDKPTSNVDYNKLVFAIIESIHNEGGDDSAVNARFDSELTEFLYVASLSYNIVIDMDKSDATKAINSWHPWQNGLYELLKDSRRVKSVRVALKTPVKEQIAEPAEEQVQVAA